MTSSLGISGIIFDLDGVLLDSTPIHQHAFRETLSGYPIHEYDYNRIAGMRTLDGMRKIFLEQNIAISEEELCKLAERKSACAHALVKAQNPVMPGCRETLARLAQKYPLAIASSASEGTVNAFLSLNDTRCFFRSILWGGLVKEAKPAPEIFLRAVAELELPANECLVIEDAIAGIEAALRAGCKVCGVTTLHSPEELQIAGAQMTISRIDQLLEIL